MSSELDIARTPTVDLPALSALIAGALAMGISPILVRVADVGPFASAFWRVALALPVLWAWDRWERRQAASVPSPRLWSVPALLAGVFFSADLFFWHLAILNTTVANATFFATTAPFWVLLGAWLLKSEAIGLRVVAGLGMAMIGGVLLVGESLEVAPGRITGDLYGLVTAVFFGLYFLAVRAARGSQGAARITFVSSCVTAAVLAVVAFTLEPRVLPETARGFAILLALALFSHAAGQGLLAFALGHLPATFSSLVIFLEAIAAALLGWIVLGEAVSLVQTLGGAIILAGIVIARPRSEEAPMP